MKRPRWPTQELPQSAVLSTVTGEHDFGTEVAVTADAHLALPTWQGRVHCNAHPVPRTALDDTGEFMTWHQWSRQLCVADAGLREPVQVGSAQPDRRDPHQFFPTVNGRHGFGVDPDIAHTV
jgi:hypothetical protein